MNLRFVEAFYWVVTLKSVTRAAEKLHLTQSAMSSRIAALEQELGTPLLDRRDRQFRLTVAGQRFLRHAERLLSLQREIRAEMGSIEGAEEQPLVLKVGAFESASHSWLMDWVRSLRETFPHLSLELTLETSPVLVDLLARGALDLTIAALPGSGSGVRSQMLPAMAMAFVGHAEHHRKRRWRAADLAALEMITFQRGSQPHVALVDALARARVEARRIHTVSSISAMVQLVEDGLGVATLPVAVLERLSRRMPLKALATEIELPPLPTHLSWRLDPTSAAQKAVVDSVFAHHQVEPVHRKNR